MKEIEIREAGRLIVADTLGVSVDECTDEAGLEDDLGQTLSMQPKSSWRWRQNTTSPWRRAKPTR